MEKSIINRIICSVLVIFVLHSCLSKNQEIVKDDNGNICLKCELKNGVRNGTCYEYYSNGVIKTISNWIAGIQNGELIEYFENGRAKTTSMWKNGKLDGEFVEYSNDGFIHKVGQYAENKPARIWVQFYQGIPMYTVQYVVVKDKQSYANQWWIYDYLGDVRKEESHYYSIYSEKGDSVRVGEPGEIKIKLEAPLFGGYMQLVVGDFDKKFNLKDSTKLDTINCVGFESTVKYQFDEKGPQAIRGIILDCREEKEYDDEKGEYTRIEGRDIYFTKTFEVY